VFAVDHGEAGHRLLSNFEFFVQCSLLKKKCT
jgi:hypothetical protein